MARLRDPEPPDATPVERDHLAADAVLDDAYDAGQFDDPTEDKEAAL